MTAVDCRKKKCIALTYDDGPDPYSTVELVATLRQHHAKATFFMRGQNVRAHPTVVAAVAASGSEIANHSWGHPSLPLLSNTAVKSELERTNNAIEAVTGSRPTLARPPYGATTPRIRKIYRRLGLAEILWTIDTEDWKYRDTDRLVRYVLATASRNDVVLMHDIHATTVTATATIITGLQAKGYTLVTVSELYPKLRPGDRYPKFQGRGFATKPH